MTTTDPRPMASSTRERRTGIGGPASRAAASRTATAPPRARVRARARLTEESLLRRGGLEPGDADARTIARNPIPSLIPQGNLFSNIGEVIGSDINFWAAMVNSILVATLTSVSVVFFATLAGFAFSKLSFRGRRALLLFVIATMAVPVQLGVIPLFIIMARLGWVGDLKAVIIPGLVTAFGVFWMTQYLDDALPFELIEAARMDGCNLFRSYWHVALPASRGAGAMLFLFTFVGSWTNFFWPFIILRGDNLTLPVALQQLQASYFKDYSLIMSGVVVSVIPLLLLFILAGRQLVGGIMQGAVKG